MQGVLTSPFSCSCVESIQSFAFASLFLSLQLLYSHVIVFCSPQMSRNTLLSSVISIFVIFSLLPPSASFSLLHLPTVVLSQGSGLSAATYTTLSGCGALACALTHVVLVPVDVVKTRLQQSTVSPPPSAKSVVEGILKEEGASALTLGTQATIVGYMYYGGVLYPLYEYLKRELPTYMSSSPTNAVVILSGAIAAVFASAGLSPMEVARIRRVEKPSRYPSLPIALSTLAKEKALYAGLSPLLARQVAFGMAKFLSFETARGFLYDALPGLDSSDMVTSLWISLLSGAFAGVFSCFVSQPADATLTAMSRTSQPLLPAAAGIYSERGASGFFAGVESRAVWSACIIAGQFLLYDLFRSMAGVGSADLADLIQSVEVMSEVVGEVAE